MFSDTRRKGEHASSRKRLGTKSERLMLINDQEWRYETLSAYLFLVSCMHQSVLNLRIGIRFACFVSQLDLVYLGHVRFDNYASWNLFWCIIWLGLRVINDNQNGEICLFPNCLESNYFCLKLLDLFHGLTFIHLI